MASSLRAPRLESMSSAFIRSTIDVRHCSFSFLSATALSRIGAISMACAGVEAGLPPPPGLAGAARAVVAPGEAASALVPKIALVILPKMLIRSSLGLRDFQLDPLLIGG